jgi:hypothetical protein
MPDTILEGTTQGSFQQSLVEIGSVVSEKTFFLNFIPHFSIFSLVAILVGSQDHGTQFQKGAIPGPFHQSLVAILSQSQPNFAEMILGWSPSKFVSGFSNLQPRWPPQPSGF